MKKINEREKHLHEFEPVFDEFSQVLILGSFPSVKSREKGFYYGHPQNRFWKVLAGIIDCEVPQTIEDKRKMLLTNHIAIWDVISSCDIIGSSDSSIQNVVPVDVQRILEKCSLRAIYVNGKTAEKLYNKYLQPITKLECISLPSTSPANAAWSLERLIETWRIISAENMP